MRSPRGDPPVLKRLGQHFLHDRGALETIANAVAPLSDETVVEIGPGRGALTDVLARAPNQIIAIELDRALAARLRERYSGNSHVMIVERDVLETDIGALANGPFAVVGNVPYYITTPILFHVLREPMPRRAVFLVQSEVADRMVSAPGSRSYGALTVNVQAVAGVEVIGAVPPGAFTPPPRVDSAIVRVVPLDRPLVAPGESEEFRRFVTALFGMRRKQLGNSLRSVAAGGAEQSAAILDSLSIDPRTRVESLSPVELAALMRAARTVRQ